MTKVLIAIAFASALASCATTQTAVVPALEGTPRVPINKEQPKPITAPAANTTKGE